MIVLNGEMRYNKKFERFLNNNKSYYCNTFIFQVEFIMVRFDHEKKKVQLVLKAHELLPILMEPENQNPE
jgi:hypothetical protein